MPGDTIPAKLNPVLAAADIYSTLASVTLKRKMSKRIPTVLFFVGACFCSLAAGQVDSSSQTANKIDVAPIVSEFTAGEDEFLAALRNYGYRSDVVIQSVKDHEATGEYRRSTRTVLKDGKIQMTVIDAPKPSLTEIAVTPDDVAALAPEFQYLLGSANAGKYDFTYAGKEALQNQDFYLFDVKPKTVTSKDMLFSGRVWVSVANLRIVKLRGSIAKKGDQRFPVTEYYRQIIDGRYLFPSQLGATDKLTFPNGTVVEVLVLAKYGEFVKLR